MRLFLSIVAVNKIIIEQVDYTVAYLNAMIDDRVIYIRQLTSFKTRGLDREKKDKIYLILQALYRLRQIGHLWYETLANALRDMDFQPLLDKPYIWIYREKQIQILLYVDNTLIAAFKAAEIDQFKTMIPFRYKDLRKLARFLGSSLSRTETGAIFLN